NSNNSSDVPLSGMPKNGKHKKEQVFFQKTKKQQQAKMKVATAPVVVFSKDQEEKEQRALKAAEQYIKGELSRGKKVNEARVKAKAIKEEWEPNEDLSAFDLTAPFKNGESYEGFGGCTFECYKDAKGIA